jgi:hypothetical protein
LITSSKTIVKISSPDLESSLNTYVVPTEFGNSFAMIAKLDVRKAAFPSASMILIMKARVMNIV